MSYIPRNASAGILAGGRSKRFGSDKILHQVNGKPLIEHVIGVLSDVFNDISIIADDVDKYKHLGLPCYPDIIAGRGPLGGLHSALSHCPGEHAFITAGDMPELNADLIRYMLSIAADNDVVIPMIHGNYEALHALYGRRCLEHVETALQAGESRIISFFSAVRVRTVGFEEVSRFAPPHRIFRNINYRSDIDSGS